MSFDFEPEGKDGLPLRADEKCLLIILFIMATLTLFIFFVEICYGPVRKW